MQLLGTKIVLFPAMEGVITFNGASAVNAKIKVHVFWKDDVGEEEIFYADDAGNFSIPAKKRRVRIPLLAELVVTQQITVIYDEDEYVIWSKVALGTDEYGGLGGNITNVRCELTDRRRSKRVSTGYSVRHVNGK